MLYFSIPYAQKSHKLEKPLLRVGILYESEPIRAGVHLTSITGT